MASDPRDLLPLKPLVFQVLVALSDSDRHGWSLVREVQQRTGGERILPANFYRTLRGMLSEGLIEETDRPRLAADDRKDENRDDERRTYFRLTAFGRTAAALEARRLHDLVSDVRTKRLLAARPRS